MALGFSAAFSGTSSQRHAGGSDADVSFARSGPEVAAGARVRVEWSGRRSDGALGRDSVLRRESAQQRTGREGRQTGSDAVQPHLLRVLCSAPPPLSRRRGCSEVQVLHLPSSPAVPPVRLYAGTSKPDFDCFFLPISLPFRFSCPPTFASGSAVPAGGTTPPVTLGGEGAISIGQHRVRAPRAYKTVWQCIS
jgi:hypothetical protein